MKWHIHSDLFTVAYFLSIAALVVASTTFLPVSLHIGCLVLFLSLFVTFFGAEVLLFRKGEYSVYLFIPLVMSATQNILLGLFAHYCSKLQIQILLTVNVVWSVTLLAFLLATNKSCCHDDTVRKLFFLLTVVFLHAILSAAVLGANLLSLFSSLRNVVSPILFFLIGFLVAPRIRIQRLYLYLSLLGLFIIWFGIYERFVDLDLWRLLNIDVLWERKGLSNVGPGGLPGNFYSSEKIGGEQIRRMASSYGDPVNFGTNLFPVFLVAWISGRKGLLLLTLAAIFLAVSKGAFLGLLVFLVVFACQKLSRAATLFIGLCTLGFGIGFVIYSLTHSTMSLVAHVFGFLASLKELPDHPFGRGIGNIGVLASQFTEITGTEITESGLGAIIGQMGVVGLAVYAVFFGCIHRNLRLLSDANSRIAGYTLFFFIILNIAFNEVALSPNSSAGVFMLLGLYARRCQEANENC